MTEVRDPAPGAAPGTVSEMLEIRLERDPDAPFLLTPDGQGVTYREVAARAGRIAARLRAAGVRRGDAVGLYLGNDPAWVIAMFGVWGVGAAVAACGTVSPVEEACRRFGLADVTAVVTTSSEPILDARPHVIVDPFGEVAGDEPPGPSAELDRPDREDVAFILFSSGTTGDAKAIVATHRQLADRPSLTAGTYSSSGSFRPRTSGAGKPPAISFNPFGQAASIGRIIFRLYVGRPVVLVPKFDVEVLRTLASRYPLDTLQLTPAMIHAVAYVDEPVSLGSLKYVNSGTAPLSAVVREAFESRYGVPVLQSYGSSEAGVLALETYEDALAGRRGPGSVGRVTAGVELRILGDDGEPVAEGLDGEIARRVPKEESTRFLTSDGDTPLPTDADGWYRTGDIGRVEDGILYITGRRKEMLVVGGFNVYPAEVEEVLRQCQGVRDAIVVGLPDDRLGEVPVGGVVWAVDDGATEDPQPDREARLSAEARRRLEAYKVPRRFFALDAVPLTVNGKIDRTRALELALTRLQPQSA